jgi:hypothetical protein
MHFDQHAQPFPGFLLALRAIYPLRQRPVVD